MRREVEALRALLHEWLRLYREAGEVDGEAAESALGLQVHAHAIRTGVALGE